MFKTVRRLIGNNSGATAIEYGLIAALISIAAITAMTTVGESLITNFDAVANSLDGAETPAGGEEPAAEEPAAEEPEA